MILKDYQRTTVNRIQEFFSSLDSKRSAFEKLPPEVRDALGTDYLSFAFTDPRFAQYADRPRSGAGKLYPRVCIKMPTAGGKTLVAIETIRAYQNLFAKKKTGLIVWITHREQIYRQTIENLQNKSHVYRQLLDQCSGNRTLILEKGQPIRKQDVEENLAVLMLMIQSAGRETNKIFEDSGGYTDFFPPENRYDLHQKLIEAIPNLDKTGTTLFSQTQVKTSLGNIIRLQNPLLIVDEFHTMFTERARATLDGLNPSAILGLSATPKVGMNILISITGKQLKAEGMIKLDLHLIPPSLDGDWRMMLSSIKRKRDALEKKARRLGQNKGVYIRPIALIQVERVGATQRGHGLVHSEDVREYLIDLGVPAHEVAVKSAYIDEIKAQKLLSKESEIRYIITKEALKEGWDCSFAYILGVIPNARTNSAMTQLVGRILRQPYAKKTKIPELDESYAFFSSGQTQEVLEKVKQSFQDEGLGDVVSGVQAQGPAGTLPTHEKSVSIKKSIRKNYPHSLFLPVWLVKVGKTRRRFIYDIDIKAQLSWDTIDFSAWLKKLLPSLGEVTTQRIEYIVGLDEQTKSKETEPENIVAFDTFYITRRIADIVENAFVAHAIARSAVRSLLKTTKQEKLDLHAGFIASDLEAYLLAHKKKQEQDVFESLIKANKLILAVSDSTKLGFAMPEKDVVTNTVQSAYRYSLYDDVDIASLNTLEHLVVQIIERSPNVLWWARNKPYGNWYAIQGWQKYKVRPDFVIARKKSNGDLQFVYVVESKGEQLLGNADTQYKDSLFQRMNQMDGSIETIQEKLPLFTLNDKFDFELVPQGEEERRIQAKLNAA